MGINKGSLIILFLCISSVIGVICFLNFEFEPHYSSFGLSDDSFKEEYQIVDSKFKKEPAKDLTIIVLERESGWHDFEDFKLIDNITHELSSMSSFESVSSITNIEFPKKGIVGYSKGHLFNIGSRNSFLKTKNTINSLNDIARKFIDKERRITLIYCSPISENVNVPMETVRQLAGEEVDCSLVELTKEIQQEDSILKETTSIALLVLLIVLLTFYYFTRSFLAMLITAGFIGCNLGLTFLVQYILGISFSLGMVSIPSLVIILSFSDLMHVLYLQSIYSSKCSSNEELRAKIRAKIKVPMLLTSVTNLIGFIIILTLSKTSGLSQMVTIALIGVVIAYLNSRFVLISFIQRTPVYLGRLKWQKISRPKVLNNSLYRKGVILTTVLVSIILSVVLIRNYKVGFNIKNYKSTVSQLDNERAELANHFFGNKSIEVVVDYENGVDKWSYESQLLHEKAENLIRKNFNAKYISSINNLVRRYNYIESFGHEKAYRLRTSLEESDINPHIEILGGEQLVSKDGGLTKMIFGFTSTGLRSDLNKYNQLENDLKEISSSSIKFRLLSKAIESDRSMQYYSIRILIGLFLGIFCAALIMTIVKKSVLLGFGTLLVNVIPVLIGACMMLILNIQINPQSLFLLSILMGVCLDDSIYLSGYKKNSFNELMFFPLFVTSFVLGLGFFALYFSSYPWLSDFSLIFIVGVLSAFLLDMFVYPLFMKTE